MPEVSVQNDNYRITVEYVAENIELHGFEDALRMAADATRAAARSGNQANQPVAIPAAGTNWKIDKWWGHLGTRSREFWEAAARHVQTNPRFTFAELAQATGHDKGALKAEHRNSWKAIRDEGAPNPLNRTWDASQACNVYTMPDEVRDELLRLAGGTAPPVAPTPADPAPTGTATQAAPAQVA